MICLIGGHAGGRPRKLSDAWLATITELTIEALTLRGNARIQHGLDDSLILRWMKEFNPFLCYLPPYSPELNMIEILWKQAKCHWREFATWSKESFRSKISELLDGLDSRFQISFA